MRTAIYIDDSGTSGLESKSKFTNKDTKTWIAVILTKEQRANANIQMNECLIELKKIFNATEFHFKDIYNGKNEFKVIDFQKRIGIFRMFAEIIRKEKYPMFIQTFSPDDFLRNKIIVSDENIKVDNFKLSDNSDFALIHLLQLVKNYLSENKSYQLPVDIIIDEGRQKKNSIQKSEFLDGYLYKNELQYKSSKDEPLLQIADFAAYCMNRVKWIHTNNMQKEIDIEFLKICERANFNILNIKKVYIKPGENLTEKYDKILEDTYKKNNKLSEAELAELKKRFKK